MSLYWRFVLYQFPYHFTIYCRIDVEIVTSKLHPIIRFCFIVKFNLFISLNVMECIIWKPYGNFWYLDKNLFLIPHNICLFVESKYINDKLCFFRNEIKLFVILMFAIIYFLDEKTKYIPNSILQFWLLLLSLYANHNV